MTQTHSIADKAASYSLDRKHNAEQNHTIETVTFHITWECSHNCSFCYCKSSELSDKIAQDSSYGKAPTFEQLAEIIDAMRDVQTILFVGGDPGAYPNIIRLAKHAKKAGKTIGILSNTLTLPDAKDFDKDIKVFDFVSVTFHADNAKEHDAICGKKGAFANSVKKLKQVSDAGIDVSVTYNIRPGVESKLVPLLEYLQKAGIDVKAAEIQRISQKGGATCGRTNDNVDLDKTCEEFKAVENMGVELIMCDKFPPCALPEEHQQYAGACDFGYTNGTVDMHGNLGRCGCETDYLLGNILEKDIQELWNSAPQLADWRNKKHLDKVCRRCPDLNDCGGACCLTRPGEYSPDILRPGLGTLRRRYFGR